MKDDIVADSWTKLHDLLFDDSWDSDILRFRSSYVFRGLSRADYDLKTSLMRLGGRFDFLEKHLIRNFRKYAHNSIVQRDDDWHWVAVAQHHGLPTRLLDWTFSPYVALHFATSDLSSYDHDGVIWCVDFVELHQSLPGKLKKVLSNEGSYVFTAEMLRNYATTLSRFDEQNAEISRDAFCVFFEPPSMDDRIINQFGVFSVMSDPTTRMDAWLSGHPSLFKRIIIPKDLKWEVRDKLDQANITERVLFPGLDGLSRWLTRHYTPR